MNLPRIFATRKTGQEKFRCGDRDLDFSILDFWQWAASDLVGNTNRGLLAEYIVARALNLAGSDVRNEWDVVDLTTSAGIKVEVKSAAYLQSWFQHRLSDIKFVVPARRGWDPETNLMDQTAKRHAHVYVFALLDHQDKTSINPLNLDQWHFYVVPTCFLDAHERNYKSLTLKALKELCASCNDLCSQPFEFAGLEQAVTIAGEIQRRNTLQGLKSGEGR